MSASEIISLFALIISICSAIFAFLKWQSANREQILRLRPQIYIINIAPSVKERSLESEISFSNCGLLPASEVAVSGSFEIDGTKLDGPKDALSHAIVVPNQTLKSHINLYLPKEFILNEKHKIFATVRIDYQNTKRKYFYEVKNKYDPTDNKWHILDAHIDDD